MKYVLLVAVCALGLVAVLQEEQAASRQAAITRLQETVDQQAELITKLRNAVGAQAYRYARGER